MGVEHEVGGHVVVVDLALAQTAVLIHFTDGSTGSDVGVGIVGIGVHTTAPSSGEPTGDVQVGGDAAGDTLVAVVEVVLVDNPVRVFNVVFQGLTGEHTVFGAVFIEPVGHILAAGPAVQSGHGTVTAAVVQTGGGEGLLGIGNGIGDVGGNGELAILLLAVETDRVLLEVGTGNHTVLGEVGGGEEVTAVLMTTGDAHVVVKSGSAFEESAYVIVNSAIVLSTPGAGDEVGLEGTVHIVITTGILGLDFRGGGDGGVSILAGYVHLYGTSVLTLLGGDEHHTVSCTGTVQGGSGRTLQHGHALDILRVDIHHTVGEGGGGAGNTIGTGVTAVDGGVIVDDTIHHEQRLVVAALGSGVTTTDDDGRTGTGGTGSLGHIDTRDLTGQGVDDVGVLVLHQFVGIHLGNGVTQGLALALDTQGGDNRFLQEFVVFLQDYLHAGGGGHVNGSIADAGNLQGGTGGGGDGESTIPVGHSTVGGSFDDDTCTRNGYSLSINNSTGNPGLLLIGHNLRRSCSGIRNARSQHEKGSRACSEKFGHFHKKDY